MVIPAGAIRPGVPDADLKVSPQHRIAIDAPGCELLFGVETVFVPARFLLDYLAVRATSTEDVVYHHVLLENHELLVSNGLISESFQPARRMIEIMSHEMRATLMATLEALEATEAMLSRPDALPTLARHEAAVLLDAFQVAIPDRTVRNTVERRSA